MKKRIVVLVLAGVFALGTSVFVSAQRSSAPNYPTHPITLICPVAAGGGTDALSRLLASLIKDDLGVPVNVVNRPGGNGVIGHTAIAMSAPDGYTIGMPTFEITTLHWLGLTELSYKDMVPIAIVNADSPAILVRADGPIQTYNDLFKRIKDNPGKLKASGTIIGGSWHLGMCGWLMAAGLKTSDVVWIPTAGAAPSLQELVSGGVDFVTCSLPEAATLIEAKKVKPLAIMSDARNPVFTDIPTLKELKVDWSLAAWRGIAAPKGTPPELAAVIERAIAKAVQSDIFKKFMKDRGFGSVWMSSKDLETFLPQSDANNGKVVEALGLAKK